MYHTIFLCSLFILIMGCNNSRESDRVSPSGKTFSVPDEAVAETRIVPEQALSAGTETQITPPSLSQGFEKKIIRNGNLTIESEDLKGSRTTLDTLLANLGGYISSENFNDQEDQLSYHITCRIPAEKFDLFVSGLEKGPDKVVSKSVNANDITEQYYDVKTRLENERQVEKRYLELLGQARTVKDILDIEEKLGQIRQEIESKEGRLRYLDDRISYSTLDVWIYQKKDRKYEPERREGFGQRLKKSLHKGWLGFVDFVLFFLRLWPLWIIGLIIWRVIVRMSKRSGRKKA